MLNKKNTILSVTIMAGIIIISVYYISIRVYSFHGNKIEKVIIGDNTFYSEVILSADKMRKGLSGRNSLCESCAMLFQFTDSGKYVFSMKDMRFPLDIIWILNGKIVYVLKSVSAKHIDALIPPSDADQVLEINAGLSEELNIKIGDVIH